jgi:hypothetical protein
VPSPPATCSAANTTLASSDQETEAKIEPRLRLKDFRVEVNDKEKTKSTKRKRSGREEDEEVK